jgi:hypothetical protein
MNGNRSIELGELFKFDIFHGFADEITIIPVDNTVDTQIQTLGYFSYFG